MSVVISDLTTAMRRDYVNGLFNEALPAYVDESWKQYSTVVASDGEGEYYDFSEALGAVREWIGPAEYNEMRFEDYSLQNKDWEYSMRIKRNVFADDKSGQVMLRVSQLAQKWGEWYAYMTAQLLENGDGTTYGAAYDGVSFFNDSHPIYDGATWDNSLALTLTADNLQTAIESLLAVKRYDNRNPWGNRTGESLLLVVPSALELTAKELTFDPLYTGGAATNNPLAGLFKPVVNRYLTDENRWYVLDTHHALRPLLVQERKTPVMDTEKSDDVTEDNAYEYRWWARGNFGYGFPQTAIMSNPS